MKIHDLSVKLKIFFDNKNRSIEEIEEFLEEEISILSNVSFDDIITNFFVEDNEEIIKDKN